MSTNIIALIILLNTIQVFSQNPEPESKYFDASRRFSVYIYGTYVSSSELQNDPKSSNPIERDATVGLDGVMVTEEN